MRKSFGSFESRNKVRKIAETSMNMRSSRSHTCFTICVEQKQICDLPDKANRLTAKINLVDLAGSERVAKDRSSW